MNHDVVRCHNILHDQVASTVYAVVLDRTSLVCRRPVEEGLRSEPTDRCKLDANQDIATQGTILSEISVT